MAIFNLFIWPRLFSPSDIVTTVPLPNLGESSSSNGTHGATPVPNPSPTLNTSATTHRPSTDWISYLLAIGLSHLPFDVDVPLLSRQISFALVGLIIASSIQYVLKSVARVLRLGGTSAGGGMLLLGLAQVMVCYLSLSVSLSLSPCLLKLTLRLLSGSLPPLPPHSTAHLPPTTRRPRHARRRRASRFVPPNIHGLQPAFRHRLPCGGYGDPFRRLARR